jgi:hypothetical protein
MRIIVSETSSETLNIHFIIAFVLNSYTLIQKARSWRESVVEYEGGTGLNVSYTTEWINVLIFPTS